MNKVELEFKRIQTYLFASPRLRAMLGANATLGQTIRLGLPELAKHCGARADPQTLEEMPARIPDDPLLRAAVGLQGGLQIDDPKGLYAAYGVLVRDGGHFIATFPEEEQARRFIEKATAFITEELPGILIEARIDGVDGAKKRQRFGGESLFQHPAFQVSQFLGNRPAESRGAKSAFVSAEEKQMEDRGRTFRDHPGDLIATLEKHRLIPCPDESPQTLEEVAGKDYLALIHADGNGIGKRYQQWRKRSPYPDRSLGAEAHGERFFHSMRVAVRRALCDALGQVFRDAPQRYQLLMLGGDDLLMVCAAAHALPFVHAYAKALECYPLCDGAPLSIGVGVATARHTFPFHRLHATAEALADSAKQRYRADPTMGSVVDWHVTSNAWLGDPLAQRRVDCLAGQAVLTGRPYPVMGERSLDRLLAATERIGKVPQLARSQLRKLVETMRNGPNLAELNWLELPDDMRVVLQEVLADSGVRGLFQPLGGTPWEISILPDLVELYEIFRRAERLHTKEGHAA